MEKEFSTGEDFASLLDEYMEKRGGLAGVVSKGVIKEITKDFVITDVGLKTEALVPIKEFGHGLKDLNPGDIINPRCVPQSEPSSTASISGATKKFSSMTIFFRIIKSSSACIHSVFPAKSAKQCSIPREK